MKKRRMSKIGLRISLAIFVAELFVFIMLFTFISNGTSSTTEESAVNNMKVVALDRSEIIKNYVQTAESSLSGYLKAGQIYDMLENLSDAAAKEQAQKYTESYGKDLLNLDGRWKPWQMQSMCWIMINCPRRLLISSVPILIPLTTQNCI